MARRILDSRVAPATVIHMEPGAGLPEGAAPARVVVASARRIDLADRKATVKALGKRQSWQADCWLVFHAIGEVKYANRFLANACSRVRLYPAMQPDPSQPPISVQDAVLPDNVKAAAYDALARVKDDVGGQRLIMYLIALGLETPGECFLLGYEEQDAVRDGEGTVVTPARPERWEVRSTAEVEVTPEGVVKVRDRPGEQPEEVPPGTFFLRIWEPDPEWRNMPDSALRAVLSEGDELLILSRAIRAAGRSRMPAGLLLVPTELSFGQADKTEAANDQEDPFAIALMEAMTKAVEDEGDPAALVPPIVRGKADHLKELRHVLLTREIDGVQAEQRKELLRRLAQGLNVPPEIVLGIADLNHWSAWQVDESTFSAHVEPRVLSICDALTAGAYRPLLGAYEGVTPEQVASIFLWYDESEVVTKPNRGEDAKAAHEAMVISDAALRQALGFADVDAPDETELVRREGRAAAARPGQPGAPMQGPPPAEQSDEADEAAAVTAAAEPMNPGTRLSRIDQDLFTRVRLAADAALARAMERAGARLRSRAPAGPTREAIANVENPEVAATLGPAVVRTLATEDDLLAGAFDGLQGTWETWVLAAQGQALDYATQTWGVAEDRRPDLERRQMQDRTEAWTWFHGALLGLARERLYGRDAVTAAVRTTAGLIGEQDPALQMPASTIREALARAGGGPGLEVTRTNAGGLHVRTQAGRVPAGGVATGQVVLDLAAEAGAVVEWYTWVHGSPPRPFPPHAELDGVRFYGVDDPNMASADAWIGGYYEPGDHDGCTCMAEPFIGPPSGGDLIG